MIEQWSKMMREDWDRRAKKNSMYYIASTYEPDFSNVEGFFSEGKAHAIALVEPMLERLGFIPTDKRMLEIGCGIGRLFPGFAELGFKEIWGVDVSPEMIAQGIKWYPDPKARFLLTNGQDLTAVEDHSIDYCFSYLVFIHVPDPEIIWRYVDEVWRVLRSGGVFQIHFRGYHPFTHRLLRLLPASLHSMAHIVYQLITLRWLRGQLIRPVHVVGRLATWSGIAVSPEQVVNRLVRVGFSNVEIVPESIRLGRFWAIGEKPSKTNSVTGGLRAKSLK